MNYVTHNRIKTKAEALAGDPNVIYYTSDTNEVVINKITYGTTLFYTVTLDELINSILNNELRAGALYCIQGYESTPNDKLPLTTAGHKINLIVEATGSNSLSTKAVAAYNTDGTDTFYEDRYVPVSKWDIEVTMTGSLLGTTIKFDTKLGDPLSINLGEIAAVSHNGVDTLIAIYNNTDKVAVSNDGGETYTLKTLPYFYTEIQGIEYGNGMFMIYDRDGKISISNDNGDTWTLVQQYTFDELYGSHSANAKDGFRCACFGNDQFYVIGNYVGIKSRDGYNWEPFDWLYYDTGYYRPAIAAGDGIVCITSCNSRIQWSFDDGLTWRDIKPSAHYWQGACFADHTFCFVAGNSRSCIVRNTENLTADTLTWPEGTYTDSANTIRNPAKVSYNNGLFYCFAGFESENNYSYTSDGVKWTRVYLPRKFFPNISGLNKAVFGPNGEMYVADTITNTVWVNPTPTQGDTWRGTSSTGIERIRGFVESSKKDLVTTLDETVYYLLLDNNNYISYKFPQDLNSRSVVYNNGKFETILYNYNTKETVYATSVDGINWSCSEFPYDVLSICTQMIKGDNYVLCLFENSKLFKLSDGLFIELVLPSSAPAISKITYNELTKSFFYIQTSSRTTTFYKLNISDADVTIVEYAISAERNLLNIFSSGKYVYISGKKIDDVGPGLTDIYILNVETMGIQQLTSSLYVTSVVDVNNKIIARTNSGKYIVIDGTSLVETNDFPIKTYYTCGNKLLGELTGEPFIYNIIFQDTHKPQICTITDEFNNTCYFDFKNLRRSIEDLQYPFFNNLLEDYSLSGYITNFKQLDSNEGLITNAHLDVCNRLDNCSICGDLHGIYKLPNGADRLQITSIPECDFNEIPLNLNTKKLKEVWYDSNRIYVKEYSGNLQCYTTDNGITWNCENPLTLFQQYLDLGGNVSNDVFKVFMKYHMTPYIISSYSSTDIPEDLLNSDGTNFITEYYWNLIRLSGGEPVITTEWNDNIPYKLKGVYSDKEFIIDFQNRLITVVD